ncbi:MAG: hypothetical protein ACK5NA_11850 [Enterococcus sp.]
MPFDMEIAATEFKENKLKVVSSVPLLVEVFDANNQQVETFNTNPDETIYPIQSNLSEGQTVSVKLIPGSAVAFYPVVQAL